MEENMKFTCEQVILTKALNTVSKAVSSRTTIPTLKGILLEVKENNLILTASDMDLTIETSIPVENTENGSIVVPAKLFNEVIRKMPHDYINITTDGLNININCLTSNSSIIGSDADEFPVIKTPEDDKEEIILNRNIFSNMIKKTSFAASIDQTKGAITGVLIELIKEELKMVAIDGFRMAVATENINNSKEESIIISARIMDEINKIITENDRNNESEIKILLDKKNANIYLDNTKISTRLIAGDFVKYREIIPKEFKTEINVNKKYLTEAIERVSILSEGKNNLIKMSIKDNVLTITSRSEEGGAMEDVLIHKDGDDIDIGFNSRFLLNIMRVIEDEEIKMQFNTSLSPCMIKPLDGNTYEYLILPVRISNM